MLATTNDARLVTILGSTGSIGQNTIKVIETAPERYRVCALTAHSNVSLLAQQAIALNAEHAVIADESLYGALRQALAGSTVTAHAGAEALVQVASIPVDWVMSALVGAAGIAPTFAAVNSATTLALANKESLVCAGSVLLQHANEHSTTLLPVDSEHNAIYQVFNFDAPKEVSRVILTASGGPFRGYSLQQMESVTREDALRHPNWQMGQKITIDSATMVNKALEVIEAYHLFPLSEQQIDVVIHPESIIHSLVEYIDGAILAEMGEPDMCVPIAHTLGWPKRLPLRHTRFDFTQPHSLHFEPIDEICFPTIKIAKEVINEGQEAAIIFNGANEVAVEAFLSGRIGFTDIVATINHALNQISLEPVTCLDDIVQEVAYVDAQVREYISKKF